MKRDNYNIAEHIYYFFNSLFYPTKIQRYSVYSSYDEEKHQINTFEKMECMNMWHLYLKERIIKIFAAIFSGYQFSELSPNHFSCDVDQYKLLFIAN